MTTLLKRKSTVPSGRSGPRSVQIDENEKQASDKTRMHKIMMIFELYRDAPLATLLRQLIAAQDDIRPEDVTIDYIRKRREKLFYPDTRYDVDSRYGGYNSRGLKSLTQNEFDRIAEKVETELARLSSAE